MLSQNESSQRTHVNVFQRIHSHNPHKMPGMEDSTAEKKSEAKLLQVSEKEKTASSHQPAQAIHTGIYSLTTCLHMSA